jgi:FLVCR family MFS transporter 7
MSNAMVWINFAPLVGIFEKYYETSVSMFDMTSLLFMFVGLPLGFVGTWCLNTLGLATSIRVAAMLNALGALVRFGGDFLSTAEQRLAMVMLGQAIAASAQPIFLDSPTLLASHWFGEHERAMANTIASVANPVGMAVGSILGPLIVQRGTDMRWLLLTMAVPPLVALLLSVCFFKERPPTPPSGGAEQHTDPFFVGLRKLVRNRSYLILLFVFGVGIGLVSSMTSVLGQVTAGQGYTDNQAGMFSLAMVVSGLVGAGVSGYLVDKTRR